MKKVKLRVTIYILTIFIMVGFVCLTCFNTWVDIHNNEKNRKELEYKYEELIDKEDVLHDEISKLQDPEYVAKYARERYLYTKDGEIVIDVSSY